MADPSCWVIGGWGQDTLSPACLEPRCEMEGQFGVTYPGDTAAAEKARARQTQIDAIKCPIQRGHDHHPGAVWGGP